MSTAIRRPTLPPDPVVDITRKRKIAVLGSRAVGKSSLVVQYIDNSFTNQYFPTIESTFTKPIRYNGVEYYCDIVDTAGQDEYTILAQRHAVGVHAYVLVYSVANRQSFELVKTVHHKIVARSGNPKLACVIVGQKCDLIEPSTGNTITRQVTEEEGRALAKSLNAAFIETSARINMNVDKVFDLALSEVERGRFPPEAEPEKSNCIVM